MSIDVVPVLNEKISRSFKRNVMRDRQVANVSQRIRDGTARFEDAHKYAERLGEDLSKALVDTMTEDNLPNGTLYYNIAKRTVVPALENNYNLVNEAAAEIQKIQGKKSGIGLGAVRADFPEKRIQGLIDKMTADDITLSEAVRWLTEPIINNSEAFVDDFVEANCKFQSDAGLKVRLIRKAEAKCCEWCANLEGSYDYGSAPSEIYHRHEFCRCTVTYESEKTSQGVWSKREWKTPKADIEVRQQAGAHEEMTAAERIEQVNQIYQDKLRVGGGDRITTRQIKKLTPEQRLQRLKEYEERKQNNRRR